MKIQQLKLQDFMIFQKAEIKFSPNINIICGENSTGKTALIKLLYSCVKSQEVLKNSKSDITKEKFEDALVAKLQGVFRPDKYSVGRLVYRKQGSGRAKINVRFDKNAQLEIGFGNRQEKHIDVIVNELPLIAASAVYIPPKEIISTTENFVSLYADYHIAFEETYYDLARLLERPLKKGPNTQEQNAVLRSFEKILNGNIIQKDKAFYLQVKGAGEFEMGLVSEGYRKLATIMYLVQSGSLSKNAILFWDEPETNMNPKMIQPMVEAIIELAKLGVQVFITTHDYFIQQCFNLAARYPEKDSSDLKFSFTSLYRSLTGVEIETASRLTDLTHNAIMEEFDQLYDREQGLLYGD